MYPWSLKQFKWFKKFFWLAFQKRMFQNASCLHATEMGELEAVRSLGITTPVAVIPNGVELSEFENMPARQEACKKLNIQLIKTIFYSYLGYTQRKGWTFSLEHWLRIKVT